MPLHPQISLLTPTPPFPLLPFVSVLTTQELDGSSSPGSGRDVDGPLVLLSSVFVVRLMTCQAPAPRLCLLMLPIFWYLHSASGVFPVSAPSSLWGQQAALCSTRGAHAVGGSPVTLDREAERRAWGRWEGSARFLDVPIGSRETPPT